MYSVLLFHSLFTSSTTMDSILLTSDKSPRSHASPDLDVGVSVLDSFIFAYLGRGGEWGFPSGFVI